MDCVVYDVGVLTVVVVLSVYFVTVNGVVTGSRYFYW